MTAFYRNAVLSYNEYHKYVCQECKNIICICKYLSVVTAKSYRYCIYKQGVFIVLLI